MKKRNLLALIPCALLLVAAQCNPTPQPPPTPPQPIPDAGAGASSGGAGPDAGGSSSTGGTTFGGSSSAGAGGSAPSTPEAAACAKLATLGCSEGENPACEAVMTHAVTSAITKIDLSCLTKASTKNAARACGFVKCP